MDNIIKVKVGDNTYGIMSGGTKIITLSSNGWVFDPTSGGYTQEVLVDGINGETSCVLDVSVSKVDNIEQAYEQWSLVFNAETINHNDTQGKIIFYAKEQTTINLNVVVKW